MECTESEEKSKRVGNLRYYLILACVMVVFVLFFQPISVQGTSMECTLINGDLLLMCRNWVVEGYEVGDIVVASKEQFHNGGFIIKRIVAVEGQVVDIDRETGTVYVDGIALDEPYVSSPTNIPDLDMFPLTVAEDSFFLLGDNRAESVDSRYSEIGLIHKTEIKGKVMCLLFPGTELDFSRIGGID